MIGCSIFGVLPVERIGWLRDVDPLLYEIACKNEVNDGPFDQDADRSRHRQYQLDEGIRIKRSLVISSSGDAAAWLLDPGERPHDDEWPAGRWSSWGAGMAWQAGTFADLMKHELQGLGALRENPT